MHLMIKLYGAENVLSRVNFEIENTSLKFNTCRKLRVL